MAATTPRLVETSITRDGGTWAVSVSLPPGYDGPTKNDRFNVLYILDGDKSVFTRSAAANLSAYAEIRPLPGRNWFPELIVATISGGALTPEARLAATTKALVPFIDSNFRTNPYAAGRALCGLTGEGRLAVQEALRNHQQVTGLFQTFIVGRPDADLCGEAAGAPLAEKTAICLYVGSREGAQRVQAARAAKAALEARIGGDSTTTVMTVDRNGEQHYKEEARIGTVVDLLETETAEGVAMASDGEIRVVMDWLGVRIERRKLERLGSLMPWHEFK